jgi:hypothetical protein
MSESELQRQITLLVSERDRLLMLLSEAYRFKRWAYKIFKENNIAFIAEQIYYKCPECSKISQVKAEIDLRDKEKRTCPFCGALVSAKDVIDPKTYSEVYPAVKPQPQTGIYRTGEGPHDLKPEVGSCFCKKCMKDVPNPLPREPCSHSYCKVCGQELTFRIWQGGDKRPVQNQDHDFAGKP